MVESPKLARQMENVLIGGAGIMVTLLLGAFAAWGVFVKIIIDSLREISRKVDQHDETDRELTARVTAIENTMVTREDLHALEMKLETRMQNVEAKIQVIEATMATREDLHALEKNMDARFNDVNRRFDALETLIKNSNKN